MKKRIVAYVRVSTDTRDQKNSYDNQKSYFEREYSKKEEYELYGIYADKGITGTSLNKRKEFNRMLTDAGLDINDGYKIISKPKFDIIFVKNTSRFARNVSVDVILKALANNNVFVYFLDLNKTTENTDDITYIQIFMTFDERDSRDKSKKVKFGKLEGAKNGTVNTNSKLFGYSYIQSENRLEIIENEANIIKTIFNLYSNGYGVRRIINYLNQNNMFTRLNKPFAPNTIKNILKNEKYMGLNNPLKYDTGEVFRKTSYAKVKDTYIIEETDKIPCIIDKDLFYFCRNIYESKINFTSQKGIYHGVSKYANKIICGKCGEPYHRNIDRGNYFYNCKTKKSKGLSACNNPNVPEKIIDEYLENKLSTISIDYKIKKTYVMEQIESLQYQLYERLDGDNSELLSKTDTDITECKNNIEVIINNLLTMGQSVQKIAEGKLSYYNAEIEKLEKQKQILSADNVKVFGYLRIINDELQTRIENNQLKKDYSIEDMLNSGDKIEVFINEDNELELNLDLGYGIIDNGLIESFRRIVNEMGLDDSKRYTDSEEKARLINKYKRIYKETFATDLDNV